MTTDFDEILAATETPGDRWALVLAGGEGTRLAEVCESEYGYARPKQFCALVGQHSLLEDTIDRVAPIIPRDRTVVSTTARWHIEAEECLASKPGVQLCEQPSNAGNLAGVVTALLDILAMDPGARVMVLPSDHHYSNRVGFLGPALIADRLVTEHPDRIVLLGAQLDEPEPGLGWIVRRPSDEDSAYQVERFVEKPAAEEAARLHGEGALANTLVLVARAATLARLIARHAPETWGALTRAWGSPEAMDHTYRSLAPVDLSHTVLSAARDQLWTVPLVGVHWSDIGVPVRLERAREQHRATRALATERLDEVSAPQPG